jgi:UDP-3-O-acyl-N-acetylglucosamine deacetylase
VELFRRTGLEEQDAPRVYFDIPNEVRITRGNAELIGLPHPSLRISFTIEYDNPVIGTRHVAFDVVPEVFAKDIAPARTFVLRRDVELLRKAGMIRGGSLGNAVVVEETGVANEEGLRFPDEFARHKVLDLIGDLYLLGRPLHAHVTASKTGHSDNLALVKAIIASL